MESTINKVPQSTLKQQRGYLQKSAELVSDGYFCMIIDFIRNRMNDVYRDPIEGLLAVMDKLATFEELQENAIGRSYELYCFASFLVNGGADEIVMLYGLF